jgi:hypothetical protein
LAYLVLELNLLKWFLARYLIILIFYLYVLFFSAMRKRIFALLFFMSSIHLNAQTGIGTTSPHVSAKLEVAATNKGFLPPRVALTGTNDLSTIATPATGLVVFNTATAGTTPNNVLPGYYYYDGTKWNQLVDQSSLNSFSGFVPNYAQSNASSVTRSNAGDIIVSQSITTSGRPVQIIATGDANPANSGAWVQLQLFRDGIAIGKKVQAESSLNNENIPYCLNFIDNPTTPGTYTYSVRIVGGGSGGFGFGESDGNHITLLELGAWSAGTMPVSKGGTGVTTSTGTGNTVLSNSPTLETPTISSGNTAFPSSINVTPTTHATSKRAALWLDGWGIMQDILGNGTKNFSISQTYGGTYPPRLFINTDGNVGIGTESPVSKLDVTGNVNVTGKINVSDPTGNVVTKVSGYVNAGTFLTFDNLKVSVTTSGNRGLSIATVSGSFVCNIAATYANTGGGSGSSARVITYNTSPSGSPFGWHFNSEGDTVTYIINDTTNSRVYRIVMMIGYSFNNNFISMERLI